ncbi:MAG: 23S rRNA (adenine(2030)-N(6))-methyltransferase RlmJ [Alphaproteobacteria bacterium]|nr:23S rRNA (adenine(2030)-N(6))-methyltransferase RlmJ [Alphaproteobacteria bacterium]
MNYRHSFHAGNFGDVLKHVVLTLVIEHLKLKPTPFAVIDTHAGTGRYDLQATESARTGEYRDGIARVLAWRDPPAELAPYLAVVRAMNEAEAGRLRWYPGSPRLARALMRRGDRLFATELHPADFAALAAEFANDRRTKTIMLDGYQALAAFVPPRERRAVVLVDPPFEVPGEFERLVEGVRAAHRRFASGIYLLWYPIKARAAIDQFHAALVASGLRRILLVELLVRTPTDEERLNGCGLIVINPPHTLAEALARLLPSLARVLAEEKSGTARLDWLVPE